MPCCCNAAIAPSGSWIAAGGAALPNTRNWSRRVPPSTAAIATPTGPLMSVGPGRPRFSSMMTNRKSTMMAPAYTNTCSTAMNWASSRTYIAARANSVTTSHSALATGLFRVIQRSPAPIAMTPKIQKNVRVTGPLLALRVRGVPQRRDGVRLGAQPLEVVDEPVPRVLRVLVVHADVDRFLGAHLLAVAAEDAPLPAHLRDRRVPLHLLRLLPGGVQTWG